MLLEELAQGYRKRNVAGIVLLDQLPSQWRRNVPVLEISQQTEVRTVFVESSHCVLRERHCAVVDTDGLSYHQFREMSQFSSLK